MKNILIIVSLAVLLANGISVGNVLADDATSTATTTISSANLTVKQVIVNTPSSSYTSDFFTIHIEASDPSKNDFPGSDNGTWLTITPGAYTVSSSPHASSSEFSTVYSPECSGVLAAGNSTTCTITSTVTTAPPATCANGTTLSLTEAKDALSNGKLHFDTIALDQANHLLKGNITNDTACALPAALAVFTIDDPSDPQFNAQTLFDGTHGITVAPHASAAVQVRMPVCNFQSDYFYSDNYPNPKGNRQNTSPYFLDMGYLVNREQAGGLSCSVPVIPQQTPPPTITPSPTPTPTITPTPTPPPPPVVPTPSVSPAPRPSPSPTPGIITSGGYAPTTPPVVVSNSPIPAPQILGASVAIPNTGRTEDPLIYLNALLLIGLLCVSGLFVRAL